MKGTRLTAALFMVVVASCLFFAACQKEDITLPDENDPSIEDSYAPVTPELKAKIDFGLQDTDPLTAYIWGRIEERLNYLGSQAPKTADGKLAPDSCAIYSDAEITRIECTDRFEDWYEDRVVEAYAVDYRLKPLDSSLLDTMSKLYMDEDGWVWWSKDPSEVWLIAENRNGDISVLSHCHPLMEGMGVPRSALYSLMYRDLQEGAQAEDIAVLALADVAYSISYAKEITTISFQLPKLYPQPKAFDIRIEGEADGAKVSFLEEENTAKTWEAEGTYQFSVGNAAYTKLTLSMSLPGPERKTIVKEIDLLPYIK